MNCNCRRAAKLYNLQILFVSGTCVSTCITVMTVNHENIRKHSFTGEFGYNDTGLCGTLHITSNIMSYELILKNAILLDYKNETRLWKHRLRISFQHVITEFYCICLQLQKCEMKLRAEIHVLAAIFLRGKNPRGTHLIEFGWAHNRHGEDRNLLSY